MKVSVDTPMGKLCMDYEDYCIGCPRFEPFCRVRVKTDDNGYAVFDEDHIHVRDGVTVYCSNRHMCMSIARNLTGRIKESTDDSRE